MKGFNLRGWVSIFTGILFTISLITGIVLYFAPQGRIAYWTFWRFLGLSKTDWTNLHIIASITFIILGLWHLYYNWQVFVQHLYKRALKVRQIPKESLLATILTLWIIISSLYKLPPLSYLIDFSDYLKKSWVKAPEYEPPYGHAEQSSLRAFCKRQNINLERALKALSERGIRVDSDKESLEEIALKNRITPLDLYKILKPLEEKVSLSKEGLSPEEIEAKLAGTGLGRKTFKELSSEFGLDMEEIKLRLKRKGIEVKDEETVKEAAERYNTKPIELVKKVFEP